MWFHVVPAWLRTPHSALERLDFAMTVVVMNHVLLYVELGIFFTSRMILANRIG